MTKLERLRELHAETDRIIRSGANADESMRALMKFADEMNAALPGLLRVCDAYLEQYTYAHNSRPECGCMMCERCRDEARARLEEMLV